MDIRDIAQLVLASTIIHIAVIAGGVFLFLHEDVTGILKFSFIAVTVIGGLCLIVSALALGSPANTVSSKLSLLSGLYVIAFLIGGGASAGSIAKGSQYTVYVLKDMGATIAISVVAFCMLVYLLLAFLMIRATESIGALRRQKMLTGLSLWAQMGSNYGGYGSNSSDFESDREYSGSKKSKKPSFSNKKRSNKDRNASSESPSEAEPMLKSVGAIARAKPVQYV